MKLSADFCGLSAASAARICYKYAMQILQVTLWIYATALMRAFDCVRKNLVVSLAPLAYSLVLSAAAMIALPLGILGGFLLGLVSQPGRARLPSHSRTRPTKPAQQRPTARARTIH